MNWQIWIAVYLGIIGFWAALITSMILGKDDKEEK